MLPMEQPWTYIKTGNLPLITVRLNTEDYYDNDIDFRGQNWLPLNGRSTLMEISGDIEVKTVPEKQIKLDKQFDWAGYHWVIPAAYSCSKGLVVDFVCELIQKASVTS